MTGKVETEAPGSDDTTRVVVCEPLDTPATRAYAHSTSDTAVAHHLASCPLAREVVELRKDVQLYLVLLCLMLGALGMVVLRVRGWR